MYDQFTNAWSVWADLPKEQEKLFKPWKDLMSIFQPEKMPGNAMENIGRFYQDWMKMWEEGYKGNLNWSPGTFPKETLEKMTQAASLYTKLLSFWNSFFELSGSVSEEKRNELFQKWIGNYNSVLDGFLTLFFPEQIKTMVMGSAEWTKVYPQFYANFFSPWMDKSPELQALFSKVLIGDQKAFADFSELWNKTFMETYDKGLNLPTVGLSRENIDKVMESLKAYTKYETTINEFNALIYGVGYDAMTKLLKKMQELTEGGKAPETFNDFYQLWWKANEETYLELFKTDTFSQMLGKTVGAWSDFKKSFDEGIIDFMKPFPIPNQKDMDSINKTVYELKKAVKEQAREIENLKAKIGKSEGKKEEEK
jgi:class III poly(R)-hydroxyalkanoic acid synthase PhaE subunit